MPNHLVVTYFVLTMHKVFLCCAIVIIWATFPPWHILHLVFLWHHTCHMHWILLVSCMHVYHIYTHPFFAICNLLGHSWVDYTCICSILLSVEFDASYTYVYCQLLTHTFLSWMVLPLIYPLSWLLEQFFPLYATAMILFMVFIPYMQLPYSSFGSCSLYAYWFGPFTCHLTFVLLLSWINTRYAHWFDFLHAVSPMFCYCYGSIRSMPTDLIMYIPFYLLSCCCHGSIHSLASICLSFWSCSYCDNFVVLFTSNILLIWVLKFLVVCSDLKARAKWSYWYESIHSMF